MGFGQSVSASAKGNLPVTACDQKGNDLYDAQIKDVRVLEGFPFSLLSAMRLLKKGFKMEGSEREIVFKKGNTELKCHIKIHTKSGMLFAIYLKRRMAHEEVANDAVKVTVDEAHWMLGHRNKDATRTIAHEVGWKIKHGRNSVC